jgi:hypothetical protein
MAMAEPREWQHHADDDASTAHERLRVAEEQRVQAEGRCFAAERRRLDAERRLAEAELLLEQARAVGERTGQAVGELIAVVARLRGSLERTAPPAAAADDAAAVERAQMADALAAAVERLRARVAEVKAGDADEPEVKAGDAEGADEQASGQLAQGPAEPLARRPPHKHSMSAIARWRNRRKQRQAV